MTIRLRRRGQRPRLQRAAPIARPLRAGRKRASMAPTPGRAFARARSGACQEELHESPHVCRRRTGGLACEGVRPAGFGQDPGLLLRRQPENFTPAINTTGTSFDAARPVYNRLTEFKRGTTEVEPGLAESWDVARRQDLHLPAAQGREVPLGATASSRRATSTPTT